MYWIRVDKKSFERASSRDIGKVHVTTASIFDLFFT